MPPPPETESPTASGFAPGNLLSAADARTGTWKRQAVALTFCFVLVLIRIYTNWSTGSLPDVLQEPLLVSTVFAAAARLIGAVTNSGAVAGFCISFVTYASMGRIGFLTLFVVFALTWVATRLGYARKQRRGAAERCGGRRASQVTANLGFGAAAVSGSLELGSVMAIAAFAEAACDTVSSEIGSAYARQIRSIRSWQVVPPGTDGGVSLVGTSAGVAAAVITILLPTSVDLFFSSELTDVSLIPGTTLVLVIAAVFGMFCDSILGATLEQRGWLNNDAVNFIGTASAALFASIVFL